MDAQDRDGFRDNEPKVESSAYYHQEIYACIHSEEMKRSCETLISFLRHAIHAQQRIQGVLGLDSQLADVEDFARICSTCDI